MDVARRLRDAQSDQLRVRRWLSNPRIDVTTVDDAVVGEALSRRGSTTGVLEPGADAGVELLLDCLGGSGGARRNA